MEDHTRRLHRAAIAAADSRGLSDVARHPGAPEPSPQAWQAELDTYIAQDASAQLPEHPVVVIGGLRVTLWKGLEQALAPTPVLMRGLGDAIIEDLSHYYPRLVAFYRPSSVVLLPGNSEFLIRDNKSATDLADALSALLRIDAAQGFNQRFVIVSPLKTPGPGAHNATIDEAMPLLEHIASREARVTLLDANALLAGSDGEPDPGLFRGDGIHLNERGYLRLTLQLRHHLQGHTAPGKSLTAQR
ncbi:MAG: hypothetical protein R3E54_01435 [Halioglobus sp.]